VEINMPYTNFGFCEKFVDALRLGVRVLGLGAYSNLEAEKVGVYKAASRKELQSFSRRIKSLSCKVIPVISNNTTYSNSVLNFYQ
jgi:hypothetical protein